MSSRSKHLSLSIRMLWPFARMIGAHDRGIELLQSMGLGTHDLALEQRIPCAVAFAALDKAVRWLDEPALGLKVALLTDQGTYGVVERVAATSPTLHAALQAISRHSRVMNEGAEVVIVTTADRLVVRYDPLLPHPPAANDLAIGTLAAFVRRHCAEPPTLREVWVTHARPSYADAYAHYVGAPVRFEMPTNALIYDVEASRARMRNASPEMAAAFETRAARLSAQLGGHASVTHRVRQRLLGTLTGDERAMPAVAKSLRMSVPTLRRKLEEEGTTYSALLDAARLEIAQRLLENASLTITEISRQLGFSQVRAFTRAFQRWTGQTPGQFRARGSHP